MIRKLLATLMTAALLAPAQQREPTIKEQVLGIPAGSFAEVKLTGKQRPNKLVGKMGEASNQGFEIQVVRDQKWEARALAFTDVKSVKMIGDGSTPQGKRGTPATHIVLGVLAAVGAGFLVLLAISASACD